MEWRDVWRKLFPRRMIDPDVRDELDFHIEGRVRELVARGWDADEARAHVLERFGDVASLERECRTYDEQRVDEETWRTTMEMWGRDVRFALRTLRKNAGFTTVVVVTLALGIGASTAVFSVVEGILLRPLPFPEPDRLVMIWQNDRATGTVRENASTSDYYDYLERSRTVEEMGIYALGTAVLARDGAPPLQLNAASVSASLATVLGIDMQVGRSFTAAEDVPDGPALVVLTDHIWRDLFAAEPTIVGSSITIDESPFEVIGVLPAGIDYPAGETDVWLPIQQAPAIATRPQHWVRVVGRLADGMGVGAAQGEMSAIMADLEVEYPNDNVNRGAFVEPLSDVGRADLATTLWVLFGAVLAVLAIACVNVANLLLARGAGRMRELAVLKAVGAGSHQITRKFFVESVLVGVMAGAAGIALAWGGVRALTALAPASLTVLGEPTVNASVLLFALAVTATICVGFGFLPTVQAGRIDLQRELKDGRTTERGRAGLALRRVLVAAQLSLAVMLLLGATLLVGTLRNLQSIDPGFAAENALRVDFALPENRFPGFDTYPNWPEIFAFMRTLEGEVEAMPGVRSSAIVLNHPLDRGFTNSFRIEGVPYDPAQGEMTTRLVTPGYFETAGVELLEGRLLADTDQVDTPPVILLNRAAADRYFPQGDVIGQRIAFWGPTFREIVGIVESELVHGLTAEPPPAMYISMYQSPPRGGKITLMARTEVPPLGLVDGIRRTVQRVDPAVPIFNVATMEGTLAEAMARERFASTVLLLFSAVATFLAVLGVHGVLSYLVAQRGHEVGVRMALGASRQDVVGLVVRQGVMMTVLGIAAGLAGAVALSGVLQSLLFGVSATAPLAYVGVGLTMALVAMGATALPAYRAASIDPVSSLRGE